MSKNKQTMSGFGGLVFSTNPAQILQTAEQEVVEDLAVSKQILRIWLERVKGGKEATVVKGYVGPEEKLVELAKMLKNKCASGGNAKDGDIILQGDHRDKVLKFLTDLGYKNVKKAGG